MHFPSRASVPDFKQQWCKGRWQAEGGNPGFPLAGFSCRNFLQVILQMICIYPYRLFLAAFLSAHILGEPLLFMWSLLPCRAAPCSWVLRPCMPFLLCTVHKEAHLSLLRSQAAAFVTMKIGSGKKTSQGIANILHVLRVFAGPFGMGEGLMVWTHLNR